MRVMGEYGHVATATSDCLSLRERRLIVLCREVSRLIALSIRHGDGWQIRLQALGVGGIGTD